MWWHPLKRLVPAWLKSRLRQTHVRLFHRPAHLAQQDYQYSDERLKHVHILDAINYLRVAELPRVYFEFGCHSARTFSAAVRTARHLNMNDTQFFAFDSFQGLPVTDPAEDGYYHTGMYATSVGDFLRLVKKEGGLELPRENVIAGFYQQSLTPELQARMPKVGVVHIDVDLYSSTVEVLRFIKPLVVVGTVLIFDDWYCFPAGSNKGERRALQEFCEANPSFALEEWKAASALGKSFFVTHIP